VAEALACAEEEMRGPGLDLVVSDLGLPDGTGFDLMRALHQKFGLHGIAVSGYGMDADREKAMAAGFVEHITKPIDSQQLRRLIAETLRQDRDA